MKIRLIVLLPILCASLSAACAPVAASRILGGDLALADPRFSALPSGLVVGFTPDPGSTKVLSPADLGRIARANGITPASFSSLCFAFPLREVSGAEAMAAMRKSLPPGGELRVLELPATRVPAGEVHFPLSGLESPASGKQLWRGYVRYAENRRAPLWAEVAVSISVSAVEAVADIPAEVALTPVSLRAVALRTSVPSEFSRSAIRIDDVVGRALKVPVKAGAFIRPGELILPPVVRRGESVRVEVRSGLARLHFDAVAEASAGAGELVELRNPSNGRTFTARVNSPSTAVLIVGSARQAL